jgi:sulfotransferase
MKTAVGRMDVFLGNQQIIGRPFVAITDALTRGFRKQMFFVEYEKLTSRPKQTMQAIYAFLEQEPFEHDFKAVRQITAENDSEHGFHGLHDIRPEVLPQTAQWPIVYDKAVLADPMWARVTNIARFWEQ